MKKLRADAKCVRRFSGLRSLAASVLVLGALGACGLEQEDSNPSTNEPAVAREELRIVTPYAITDLDPAASGFWAPEFGYGELLMQAQPDGSITPWVLKSLEPTGDTTWSLTLNEGVTFQNGNALDGETLAELINHTIETASWVGDQLPGGKAVATGPVTVELTTSEPVGIVPAILANESNVALYDLEAAKAAGKDVKKQIEAKMWTGPFVVDSITADDMELVANDSYWGGTPHLKKISLGFIPDAQARVLAVQAGEADIGLYPETTTAAALEGRTDAVFKAADDPRASIRMVLNLDQPVLADVEVRRALGYAIDYAEIADDVFPAAFEQATGMYPDHLPFALSQFETNVDEANAILDAAGWTTGSDGIREKDGEKLQLSFIVVKEVADILDMGVAIQAQLKDIGADVKVQQVDDVYDRAAADDNWSATFLFGSPWGNDYVGNARSFMVPGESYNIGNINDPQVTDVLDRAITEPDVEAQYELLRELQTLNAENAYSLFPAERKVTLITGEGWDDYVVPVTTSGSARTREASPPRLGRGATAVPRPSRVSPGRLTSSMTSRQTSKGG